MGSCGVFAKAMAPGSCGELVQGSVDGVDFLVTCPVDLYSCAEVLVMNSTEPGLRCSSYHEGLALALDKTLRALRLGLRRLGVQEEVYVDVKISSRIPRGKGMASSTADISAALGGLYAALDQQPIPWEIAEIALQIEPTDGIMFQGVVQFDHRSGSILRFLGMPPAIEIIVVDPGGEVDTVAFNSNPDLPRLNRRKEPQVKEALALVEEGLRSGDARAIGEGCTISTIAHQEILPKPCLDEVLCVARHVGALGVNCAHSGTVLGVLIDPAHTDVDAAVSLLRKKLPQVHLKRVRLVGGGVRVVGKPCRWRNTVETLLPHAGPTASSLNR